MWIKTESNATARLKAPFMDEAIEFSSNGTANVEESVATRLIEEYDSISSHESDDQNQANTEDEEQ